MANKAHPESLREAQMLAAVYNASLATGEKRMDADETNMLALELEGMRARTYEVQYPELKARRFLPVSTEFDPGQESFAYDELDYAGEAKVIANYADDPPTVETSRAKVTRPFVGLGDSFVYTMQDLRRAAFSGQPLSARKAMAARRAWERGLDTIAATGAPAEGIADGVCNKTIGTGATQIRGTAMTAANWTESTFNPNAVVNGINAGVEAMISASSELWSPTILLLPTAIYLKVAHKRMSTENSETVMEAVLRSNPFLTAIEPWNALYQVDGTGGDGANGRGLLLAQSPDVVELCISQEFEVLPPQQSGFAWKVLCHGRTAGACVYRPLGMHYLSNLPDDPTA